MLKYGYVRKHGELPFKPSRSGFKYQIILLFCAMVKCPELRKYYSKQIKLMGGLSLPDFTLYYWSANIHKLMYRFSSSKGPWSSLEENSCLFTSLQDFISTFKIWGQFRSHFKFVSASSLMQLFRNYLFPPSITDPVFSGVVW